MAMGRAVQDTSILDDVARWAAGAAGFGGGAVAAIALIRWFVTFIAGRIDRRQERLDLLDQEIDKKWQKYRETIEGRLEKVEAENEKLRVEYAEVKEDVDRCHAEKRELERRLAKLEGFATGRGEAIEMRQIGESADRILPTDKKSSRDAKS